MRNDMTDEEYEQLEARETDGAQGCAYLPAPETDDTCPKCGSTACSHSWELDAPETSAAAKSKFDWEPVAKELAAELERVKRSMESWQQTADKLNQELERVRQQRNRMAAALRWLSSYERLSNEGHRLVSMRLSDKEGK